MRIYYSKENDGTALSVIFKLDQIIGMNTEENENETEAVVFVVTDKYLKSLDCLVEAENIRKEMEDSDIKVYVIADRSIAKIPKRLKWLEEKTVIWISDISEINDACLEIAKNIVLNNEYTKFRNMKFSKLIESKDNEYLWNLVLVMEQYGSDVKVAMVLVKAVYMYILQHGIKGKTVKKEDKLAKNIEYILSDRAGTDTFTYTEYEFAQTCLKRLMY